MSAKLIQTIREQQQKLRILSAVVDAALDDAWQQHVSVFNSGCRDRLPDETAWKEATLKKWKKAAREKL